MTEIGSRKTCPHPASWILFVALLTSYPVYSQEADNETVDVPSESEQRELQAEEDPLKIEEAERELERELDDEKLSVETEQPWSAEFYASLRLRYRGSNDQADLEDGSSRLGLSGDWHNSEGLYLLGRYESGFNLLDGLEGLASAGETAEEFKNSFFTRLAYLGVDAPGFQMIAGKNWSSYYTVSGLTDRFMGTGGTATGTFNAQTDGGATGTGRADNVLQGKFNVDFLPNRLFKPFELDVQIQDGNRIPFGDGASYDYAAGFSAMLATQQGFNLGIAYNHASIDLGGDPQLRQIGIYGDAQAFIIGTRAFGDRWYAGLTYSVLKNHETTNDGIYFGYGSEFYGQVQLSDRFWLIGGYNYLTPSSGQDQAGAYEIKFAVLGFRYTFDKFRRMFYGNMEINDSINRDGTRVANVYTVGIRWDVTPWKR